MHIGNDIVDIASESLVKIRPLTRLFFLQLFSCLCLWQLLGSSGKINQLGKIECFAALAIISKQYSLFFQNVQISNSLSVGYRKLILQHICIENRMCKEAFNDLIEFRTVDAFLDGVFCFGVQCIQCIDIPDVFRGLKRYLV